ncbi:MAG: SRPBCC family protein, partial [Chloroflexota bacterium]
AWEYLPSPARRLLWQSGVTEIVEEAAAGRRGVGTTNHCVHGKDAVVEEILDWRPPEYFTLKWQMPIPGSPKVKTTYELTPTNGGTAIAMRMERPRSVRDRAFLDGMLPGLQPIFEAGIATLTPLITAEMARRAIEAEGLAEPALPESAGRFLADPVDSMAASSS